MKVLKDEKNKKFISCIVLVLLALISFFVISKIVSQPDFHSGSVKTLDDKKITVMELIAASAATSTAISLIPGDAAMPIANQISSMSSYLLIVICVIVIEKYLLTMSGFLTFSILIPVACILYAIYLCFEKQLLKSLAVKLSTFGIVLFLLVPTSVKVTAMIEATYDSSIQESIDNAKESVDTKKEDDGWLSNFVSSVETVSKSALDNAEKMLGNFVEGIAVLVVTSCIIPILVLFCFVGLVKVCFNINVAVPAKLAPLKKGSKKFVSKNKPELLTDDSH